MTEGDKSQSSKRAPAADALNYEAPSHAVALSRIEAERLRVLRALHRRRLQQLRAGFTFGAIVSACVVGLLLREDRPAFATVLLSVVVSASETALLWSIMVVAHRHVGSAQATRRFLPLLGVAGGLMSNAAIAISIYLTLRLFPELNRAANDLTAIVVIGIVAFWIAATAILFTSGRFPDSDPPMSQQ